MQLNGLNLKKVKLILKKSKLDNNLEMNKMLFNNLISTFDNILEIQIINRLI